MLKKEKIKILIFIVSITILASYFIISSGIGNDKFKNLKSLLNKDTKELIKKYIFPYKKISKQQEEISRLEQQISQQQQRLSINEKELTRHQNSLIMFELDFKESGKDVEITKENSIKLSNNLTLKKYKLTSGFYIGTWNIFPGNGYIDFYEGNILVLSSRGVLAFKNSNEDVQENFKQIKNNINDFIGIKQFKKLTNPINPRKSRKYSIKDMVIINDKIFISFTEEIKQDCWNTSIIYGNIDYNNINFKKLFTPKNRSTL